jgi:short-subunit dehydrogenase
MNRKILISGVNGGIGSVLAKSYLETGAQVFGISRSKNIAIEHKNFNQLRVDLSNPKEIKDLKSKLKEFEINQFIHAAMHTPKHQLFLRVSMEDMRDAYQVGVISALEIFKSIYLDLKKSNGDVFFLGSYATQVNPAGQSPYLCSKTALGKLAQCLNQELNLSSPMVKQIILGPVWTAKFETNVSEKAKQLIYQQFPKEDILRPQDVFEFIEKSRGQASEESLRLYSKRDLL